MGRRNAESEGSMNDKEINKALDEEFIRYRTDASYAFRINPEQSEWQCYMFGNRPDGVGIVYRPSKGKEPNWFVRLMMRICFNCLWVRDKA